MDRWFVLYHHDALPEFEAYRDRKVRLSILTVVSTLSRIGPGLVEPHSKKIQNTKKLRELRPKGGRSTVRAFYVQRSEREFIILAIGPEADADPSGFKAAVQRTRDRARDLDIDIGD